MLKKKIILIGFLRVHFKYACEHSEFRITFWLVPAPLLCMICNRYLWLASDPFMVSSIDIVSADLRIMGRRTACVYLWFPCSRETCRGRRGVRSRWPARQSAACRRPRARTWRSPLSVKSPFTRNEQVLRYVRVTVTSSPFRQLWKTDRPMQGGLSGSYSSNKGSSAV